MATYIDSQKLADTAYNDTSSLTYNDVTGKPVTWTKQLEHSNDQTGYYGAIYKSNTGEYVMVNRGTQAYSPADIANDAQMVTMSLPAQYADAKKLMELAISKDIKLSGIVGHSLGGALAQMLGVEYNIETTTFNAFSSRNILDSLNPLDAGEKLTLGQQKAALEVQILNSGPNDLLSLQLTEINNKLINDAAISNLAEKWKENSNLNNITSYVMKGDWVGDRLSSEQIGKVITFDDVDHWGLGLHSIDNFAIDELQKDLSFNIIDNQANSSKILDLLDSFKDKTKYEIDRNSDGSIRISQDSELFFGIVKEGDDWSSSGNDRSQLITGVSDSRFTKQSLMYHGTSAEVTQARQDIIDKMTNLKYWDGSSVYTIKHSESYADKQSYLLFQHNTEPVIKLAPLEAPTGVFRYDPLVLDLDGDGIETVGLEKHILFDHQADGTKNATGWVAKDDGLLVMDRNGDGQITTGQELFGDNTVLNNGKKAKNGYEALADLDSDTDGLITAADTKFNDLRVWQDINQDGVSQATELKTLTQVGISKINVHPDATTYTLFTNGNVRVGNGGFSREDGSSSGTGAFNFTGDESIREFTDVVDTSSVIGLPDVKGSGRVRDLREAAALSPDLAASLNSYVASTTKSFVELDVILQKWGATASMDTYASILSLDHRSGLSSADLSKLQILEKFSGSFGTIPGFSDPGWSTVKLSTEKINTNYGLLLRSVGSAINFQSSLQDSLNLVNYKFENGKMDIDLTQIYESINLDNAAQKIGDVLSIADYFKRNTDFVSDTKHSEIVNWVKEQVLDKKVDISNYYFGEFTQIGNKDSDFIMTSSAGSDMNSNISAGDGNNFIFGLAGNDRITGGIDNDFIRGGAGDDVIYDSGGGNTIFADDGNDLVWAGDNCDYIEGGNGDDRLAGGWGVDTIYGGDGNDTIYGGQLQGKLSGIDSSNTLFGGNGNDIIYGEFQDDKLYGDNGNDMLYGSYGNDIMDGGAGDDYLGDGWGNNTFIGGSGNDTLKGGTGNDSYIFNLGEGKDIVIDAGGVDTIICGNGITKQNINFIKDGNNLLICIDGDTVNSTIIQDWYLTPSQQIEQFKFADGTTIATNTLIAQNGVGLIASGFSSNDAIIGSSFADILRGLAGNDSLSGLAGNDTLIGSTGSDLLNGGLGNDHYQFALGDGADIIEDSGGNDSIEFAIGVKREDLEFNQVENDLILRNNKTADQVTIKNWIVSADNQIEHLVLNETSLSLVQLVDDFNRVKTGTNGDDNLILNKKVAEVNAKAGNDTIVDQTLNNTNYIFNLGDGQDSIRDRGSVADKISFGAGINLEQLQFVQSGGDLIVTLNSQDRIIIKDYALQDNRIESLSFADGGQVNLADILYQRGVLTDAVNLKLSNNSDTVWSSHGGSYALRDGDNQLIISNSGQSNNISAGIGNDNVLIVGDSDNKLSLGAGNNQVSLESGNNTITTGAGNDKIFAQNGNNVIRAGDGDNLITLGIGTQNIVTGNGNDTIKLSAGNIALNSGAGDDLVTILDLQELQQASINLGDGDDQLNVTGHNGLAKVTASLGNDKINLTGVNTQISDSGGNNMINIDNHELLTNATNTLRLGANEDVINIISDGTSSISLGNGNNQLNLVGNGINSITAGVDNDSINIIGGVSNKLSLGAGDNQVDVRGSMSNAITTGLGNDIINVQSGDNIIRAGDGENVIGVVSLGTQNIVTGAGNDSIELSSGNIILNSGAGNDNIVISQSSTSSNNSINLGDGDDFIEINAAGGSSTINGSTGNDQFTIYNNSVKLNDGGGNNIIHLDNSAISDDINTINLGLGDDQVTVISNGQTTIKTSNGDNVLNLSGAGSFNVTAGTGMDNIDSGAGNDILNSGAGNDTINGNAGDDRLIAGAGNDTLSGGGGNDVLEGGTDDDSYYFNAGDGQDVIKDSGGIDQVVFGDGVLKDDLWFMRSGKDLVVNNTKTQDEVKVTNWFGSKNNQLESFSLASGEVLSGQAVASLVQAMASFNPQPMAETSMNSAQQSQYQDILKNTWVDPTK